ncbi:SRPBCC family protein [Bradyrhizobium prioriisuperbiae]|uniref:SRPBCC family protein n=1 Tax=Bradyrhizobium prioriisuperbiae TaxID=2854389 RepID=UPI0028EC66D3|nr:SRPBCC family protein [Bradyrhizobium prioritasuperba]
MLTTIAVIAIIIAVLLAAVLIYAATRPNTFVIQRTASIKAPAARIQPLIDDFRQWPQWSPYETKDPAMARTFSGAPSGKGSVYAWQGDKNVGSGRMEIIDTSPSKVTVDLQFIAPFKAHNTAEFSLVPSGDSTQVTWAMRGPLPYMAKIMHMFINMDRMVGNDFAAGLANLKAVSER